MPALTPFSPRPLVRVLDSYFEWVATLGGDQYRTPPPGHKSGAIGGHTRHLLDHVRALFAGLPSGYVDYDARDRDAPAEHDPRAAVLEWARLRELLLGIAESEAETPLLIGMAHEPHGARVNDASNLRRELSFVFSHTVHHLALVALVADLSGIPHPSGLGLAPSTAAHLSRASSCAR